MEPPTIPTIAEILDMTPEKYKPFVAALGPGLLVIAGQGLKNISMWVMRIAAGDTIGAYQQVLDALPDKAAFLAQWDVDDALLDQHNAANAANIAVYRNAGSMVLQGLLGLAGLLLGF